MMAAQSTLIGQSITAELAVSLPPYDPLEKRSGAAGRVLIVLSILLHLSLLVLFWNTLISAIIQEEEVITVRMIEEQKPEPEPPKLKRKAIARRVLDASVRRFKKVTQHKVDRIKPVTMIDPAQKIDVKPVKITEAPKTIKQRKVVSQKVSPFGEVQRELRPVQIDKVAPTVRSIKASQGSTGPRQIDAAGPTPIGATDIEAPMVHKGIISSTAIEGDVDGSKVVATESGLQDGVLDSGDGLGLIAGGDMDCMKDPVCVAYLKEVERRVYARWQPGMDVASGNVKLRFRIDRGGSAHGLAVVDADEKVLGDTCLLAFRHASPFPPPPREIHYLVTKGLKATFRYSHD